MTFAPFGRAYDAFEKVMGLAADIDDVDLQAGLLYLRWSLEFMSGDQGAALISARRLTAITPGGDIRRLTADRILGASLLSAGKLSDAQGYLQRVVDFHVTPSGGHHSTLFRRDPHVLARVRLARVLSLRGYVDRGYAEARSSFEMAQASGAGITVCWAVHDALCPIALGMGDLEAAEAATATMSDWAMRIDATLWKVMATCWKGRLLFERGEVARGTELMSQALGRLRADGLADGLCPVPRLGCRRPDQARSSRGGRLQTGAGNRVGGEQERGLVSGGAHAPEGRTSAAAVARRARRRIASGRRVKSPVSKAPCGGSCALP